MTIKCNVVKPAYISSGYKHGSNAIDGFSTMKFYLKDIRVTKTTFNYLIDSAKIRCTDGGTYPVTYEETIDPSKIVLVSDDGHTAKYAPIQDTFVAHGNGTWNCYVDFTDVAGNTYPISIGSFVCEFPTWSKEITVNLPPPAIGSNGKAVVDYIKVYQWDEDNGNWSATYDTYYSQLEVTDIQSNSWKFKWTFNDTQVSRDGEGNLQADADVYVEFAYKHYDTEEKEYRKAFFSTTRNQNYTNGIYNEVFVSGVVDNPNYSSRVWWSAINDPLYFPDTNYSEVGSNDTAIVGLTKVGDYLAVIKQSKSTDTAIYLLYPTSFEEETTFAVKQGVQGIGALARYAFNILGSETLFLSPRGVMAIVPSQDEEHKVQNRSYYVDGQLLDEEEIAGAYSFVYDGKYFLSVPNDKGSVYVLDGNQRNSWGNDRTNLVYECYYLENVPAKCFAKYSDRFLFSDGFNVCAFTDGFVDAYDMRTKEENVPVKARWTTVFDDDGSLHYYKTMQKKGNLVSILPLENELPYKQVSITEEEFDADKTLYFVNNGSKYVQCTEESEYDPAETYYVENRSRTEVYVKKDDKDEVKIERSFGLSSSIPSEMFLNKKFKKYKRLQFIIRNETAEDFGIDEIVKNYTVGNYAKK